MNLNTITAGNLPLELEALQAFALEQNRLACVLWEQLESLQHQIAQLNRARFGASSAFEASNDKRGAGRHGQRTR